MTNISKFQNSLIIHPFSEAARRGTWDPPIRKSDSSGKERNLSAWWRKGDNRWQLCTRWEEPWTERSMLEGPRRDGPEKMKLMCLTATRGDLGNQGKLWSWTIVTTQKNKQWNKKLIFSFRGKKLCTKGHYMSKL